MQKPPLSKWNARAELYPCCPDFEIVEEPTDVGEKEVADLGLVLERGLDFREGILEVPVLIGKGKRGADLFEAGSVLPVSQEPVSRERKIPGAILSCGLRFSFAAESRIPATEGLFQAAELDARN